MLTIIPNQFTMILQIARQAIEWVFKRILDMAKYSSAREKAFAVPWGYALRVSRGDGGIHEIK